MTKKSIILTYVIGIHLLLGVVLLESDFIKRVERKVGITHPLAEPSKFYRQMLCYHTRMDGNVPDRSVIFIGDSITQGLAVNAVVTPSVNYGIGGDTTAGVLQRLSIYQSIKKAKAVVIAIGINDIWYLSNDEIFYNFKAISMSLPRSIPVIFSAILPIDEGTYPKWQGMNQNRITKLNYKLESFIKKSNNRFFVNASQQLVDRNRNLANQFHIGDGLHLNAKGNAIWISILRGLLEDILLKTNPNSSHYE